MATMKRRTLLQAGLGFAMGTPALAALKQGKLDAAADVLGKAADAGQVQAASLFVRQGDKVFARSFGAAKSIDDIFLLASISKTIAAAAVMKLYDAGKFSLDDRAKKFLPEFADGGREKITMRQLLTHVSGLPDQLPNNAELRARHAPLSEFVAAAMRTPLLFEPGTRYHYSSMAILLAAEAAQRISGTDFSALVDAAVYTPLGMKHSAMGLGRFELRSVMRVQTEKAAPESGGGKTSAKDWDWNSQYWRKLGAPWGGGHGSAVDVASFLTEFIRPTGRMLQPATLRLMISNQNPDGIRPRGLGFDIGTRAGGKGLCNGAFGHEGSTGTLCWADPATDTICVVLTTLPLGAAEPHPCKLTSNLVAEAVG
jgi:CubicO group peptidase (beta-lactamase class C family)